MVQEIITYLIIGTAFIAAGFKIYKALPFKQNKGSMSKCGSCSTGCALKDLSKSPVCPPSDPVKIYL